MKGSSWTRCQMFSCMPILESVTVKLFPAVFFLTSFPWRAITVHLKMFISKNHLVCSYVSSHKGMSLTENIKWTVKLRTNNWLAFGDDSATIWLFYKACHVFTPGSWRLMCRTQICPSLSVYEQMPVKKPWHFHQPQVKMMFSAEENPTLLKYVVLSLWRWYHSPSA